LTPSIATVFVGALITALATGLGALPLGRIRDRDATRWLGIGHAFAAGLMIAASAVLIADGWSAGPRTTAFGMTCGLVAIWVVSRSFHPDEERLFANLQGANARRAILIVGVMTAHSAAEGAGLGVSFGEGAPFGWAMTVLIALHNVPEGLAIALIMVPAGASVRSAAGWSIVSSLPQPLIAVPAFAFVTVFAPALPWGLGLAGGAMIWMSLTHLVPEACEQIGSWRGAGLTAAVTAVTFCLLATGGYT
jgi:zinc transporter ZupT